MTSNPESEMEELIERLRVLRGHAEANQRDAPDPYTKDYWRHASITLRQAADALSRMREERDEFARVLVKLYGRHLIDSMCSPNSITGLAFREFDATYVKARKPSSSRGTKTGWSVEARVADYAEPAEVAGQLDDRVHHVLQRMGTALPNATRVELIRTALRKRGYERFSEAPIGEQYELALTVERELLG